MNWNRIFLLYKKELLEFVRDKRTFLLMILIPAILYPGMLIVTSEVAAVQIKKQQEKVYQIAIQETLKEQDFIKSFDESENIEYEFSEQADLNKYSAFLELKMNEEKQYVFKIHYDNTKDDSRFAYQKVYSILIDYNDKLQTSWLKKNGFGKSVLSPVVIEEEKKESQEKESRYLAGRILPGIMLLMLAVGCSFIANEITAGEKERGTLETALCSPLSKIEIVTGKFLTVMTVGFTSGCVNLGSMALTLSQLNQPGIDANNSPFANLSLPLSSLPLIIICLIGIASLVAGLCLTFSALARTVQEASQFMIPVILLLSLPILLSSMPGSELSGATLFIPFLNFCLLFQELLLDIYNPAHIAAVIVSTLSFNAIVIYGLFKIFSNEAVLFNHEGKLSFSLKRSLLKEKTYPEAEDSLLFYFVMLPMAFFALSTLPKYLGIFYGTITAHWSFFGLLSIIFLWYLKCDIKKSLSLRKFHPLHIIFIILLVPSTHILLGVMHQFFQYIGFEAGFSELQEKMKALFDDIQNNHGTLGLFFLLSITPGVCEEILFRGTILSGLRQKFTDKQAMWIQAGMFGLIHFSAFRFPGTAIAGALITYILIKTRSLYCCVLFHILFNATPVLVTLGGDELEAKLKPFEDDKALQFGIVALALILFVGSIWGMRKVSAKKDA